MVDLRREPARLVIAVTDDGTGTGAGTDLIPGSGLRAMADRVEALDGRLTIEPAGHGPGTTIRAELPCGS